MKESTPQNPDRLARECLKLDPKYEKELAEEDMETFIELLDYV